MKLLKTVKSYTFYTVLCLCSFAFVYAIIYWISDDLYWVSEMLDNTQGRGAFAMMFILTSGLSAIICLVGSQIKQNN
jgi:hypothetical protein